MYDNYYQEYIPFPLSYAFIISTFSLFIRRILIHVSLSLAVLCIVMNMQIKSSPQCLCLFYGDLTPPIRKKMTVREACGMFLRHRWTLHQQNVPFPLHCAGHSIAKPTMFLDTLLTNKGRNYSSKILFWNLSCQHKYNNGS